MADPPVITIQKDYADPSNVTSEVPGTHELREVDTTVKNDSDVSTKEVEVATGVSLSPVITVTQNESVLTKGGVRSHKITVTEDIAEHHTENGGHRIIGDITTSEQAEKERVVAIKKIKEIGEEGNMDGEKSQEERKSKIPITRLRQVVEKVKKERLEQKNRERQKNAPRRSSIPKLKESKIPSKRHTSLKLDPKPEDEFDKIYEEIVDNKQKDIDDKILEVKIEDTAVVESKFEEIIHAYDEDAHTKPTVSRVSKIPALRRRDDDRPSKIGALVDSVRAKSPKAEPELKDGGFKVTNISIKRFARGTSRDLSRDEGITVAEGTRGNEIRDKKATPPVKPARTYSKEVSKDGATIVETIEDTTNEPGQTSYTKTIRKDTVHVGIPVRTERIIRGISRELRKDDQDVNEEYNTKNKSETETVTTETEGGTRTVTTTTIEREIGSIGIPITTERVVRSISRGFSKDSQNNEVEEPVTTERVVRSISRGFSKDRQNNNELEKPVTTEKIVRNISREISSEGQIINKTGDIGVDSEFVSIMETSRGITNTYTKQTSLRENVKVIPAKPERFTRGISIEMGNIKQRDEKETVSIEEFREKSFDGSQKFVKTTQNTITTENMSEDQSIDKNKEVITTEETKEKVGDAVKETFVTETVIEATSSPTDKQINKVISGDIKQELREDTINTENVVKEFIKTGIPVLTKVTETPTKDKTENVGTNPFEWKTADEFQTKNYNRSVSENVTTKEIKNSKWKFNTPSFDGGLKDASEKPKEKTVTNKYISSISMQENPRADVSKGVTENINNVTIKKVTEYESKEKETNVEKKTYSLSNPYDFTIESISKDNKDKKEKDSKQDIKVNKNEFITDTVNEKRETEYRDVTTLERDTDNNEVTILKGNVSRLKHKISSIDNVKISKLEADEDLPKNKSVSSKIAAFERLDPTDYPREKKYLCRKKANRTYIDEKPKIVDEVLKTESYDDRNKVKIGVNYEEVEFKNKEGVVNEFWKQVNENAGNVTTINKVISEKTIYLETGENTVKVEQNVPETKAFDTVRTLPEIINFTPNESRLGSAKTMPGNIEFKTNDNQFEVAKPLPAIINFDVDKEIKVTESILIKNDNKTDPYELPKILPDKVDYETRIGKTRPGKINLNIWKNQVEVNKTLLNKEDILKKENLDEIAKVLPDKKDYTENKVQVIKTLPKIVDLNKDGHQYEVATLLPGKINFEVDESIKTPSTLPLVSDIKAKESVLEDRHIQNNQEPSHQNIDRVQNIGFKEYKIKSLESKIPKPSPSFDKFELPTILPDKKDYLKSRYVDTEIIENKEVTNTSIPGKINLNLWKNKVEENKTLLSKIHIKKSEDIEIKRSIKNQVEIISTLPGRIDLTVDESHVKPIRTLPGQIDFTPSGSKLEPIKTLPGQIDFTPTETKIEPIRTLPGQIDFSPTETKIEPIRTLPGLVDSTTHESRVEPIRTLPGRIDFIPAENKIEPIGTLPGQIDFIPTDSEIEAIRTLPGKIDFTPSKSKREPIRTLPGQIDFTPSGSVKEPIRTLPGQIDFTPSGSVKEPIRTLPGQIDFTPSGSVKEPIRTLPGQIDFTPSGSVKEPIRTLPGQIDFTPSGSVKELIRTLPGQIDFTASGSVKEPIRTLPGQIDFTPSGSVKEPIRTLPGQIDFTPSGSVQEPIRTLPGQIDFTPSGSVKEPIRTLPGQIDFTPSGSVKEPIRTLPGQIDFIPTDSKIEPIRTLPGQIDFTPTKSKNEPIRTLPAVIDINTHEIQIEPVTTLPGKEPKPLPGKLDLKAWENQIEGNKIAAGSTSSEKNHNIMIKKNIEYVSRISEAVKKKQAEAVEEFKEQKIIEPEIAGFLPGLTIGTRPRLNHYIGLKFPDNEGLKSDTKEINNGATVPSDTDPRESLSDPELVNDEPEVQVPERKNSIMDKIKSKMYFITNKNIIHSTSNISVDTESKFTEYDDTVEDLITKSYVIDDLYSQSKGQDSSVTTEEYKTEEYTKESYEQNEKNNMNVEHENEVKTSIKTTDFTSNINVTSEYSYTKQFTEETSKYEYQRSETTEEYKTNREEMKRAKSLAELDLGDVIAGQVRRMVGRMKSVDFDRRKDFKVEKISIKEMPKKMSVLEKIALFEEQAKNWYTKPESLQGKAAANQATTTPKARTTTKTTAEAVPEEVYLQKIQELETAKNTLGRMEKMMFLTLNDGREMPVIAVGTALVDNRLLPHLIGAAIDLGYRAFDTAYIYGNEKEIGKAIRAKIDDGTVRREELFIMSKLWSTFHRRDLVEQACRSSLQNMGLDYFDLYMIHNPMSFKEGPDPIPKIASVVQYSEHDYMDAWFGMEGLLPLGLARSLGVSNFNSQQIQRVLDKGKVKPVVNQVECHPYLSQERLHAYCADRNIVLSCFGVLGSKGTPAEFKSSVTPVIDDPLVKVMASGLGVTPAQLLIRYQIEFGHNVVVKASSATHLWDNLQALTFSLDKGQVAALQAINRNKRIFTFKGMGDTHKNYPFVSGH